MKRLKTILHYHSKHFKYIAIITIIYSLININFFPYQSKYSKEETKFEGTITKLKIKENKNSHLENIQDVQDAEGLMVYYVNLVYVVFVLEN